MQLITLDFETFYDRDYSLSKLTTENYVRHRNFEVIGVAIKQGDEDTYWVSGTHEEVAKLAAGLGASVEEISQMRN